MQPNLYFWSSSKLFMNLTFYGHACFSVEIKGIIPLFDPFISPNPKAKGIDIEQIKPDYLLVSHGHSHHIVDHFTMGEEDAILAADFVNCKTIVGVHYNTFEPIEIDTLQAQEAFAAKGKKLWLLAIGTRLELHELKQ